MKLFFTDSIERYERSSDVKVLFDGYILTATTLFSDEKRLLFNAALNGFENIGAEEMIVELESVCNSFPEFKTDQFLSTRKTNYDKAYSLLYPNFKKYVLPKNLLLLVLKSLINFEPSIHSIQLDLSETYYLITQNQSIPKIESIELRPEKKTKSHLFLRNIFYFLKKKRFNLLRKNTYTFTFYIFDTPNDIDLIKNFIQIIKKQTNVLLNIVQIESGIPQSLAISAKSFQSSNISVYKLQDFRSPVYHNQTSFNKILKKSYPKFERFANSPEQRSQSVYQTFLYESMKRLQPNKVVYFNTGEIGRQVSDVARFLGITSANVEYSLFSDDFIHMASNIQFDYKFCLGKESIKIWKNKKDPTKHHIPIGFLKLDNLDQPEPSSLINELLTNYNKIVFFASTWAGTNSLYNDEKVIIVNELAKICKSENWALLIKKHPAERDESLNTCWGNKQDHVFLFEHHEISLHEILHFCDVVVTQNSGVTLEALVHQKPIVFYNKSEHKGFAELIPLSKESFVFFANNSEAFVRILLDEIPQLDKAVFQNATENYLYKLDKQASQRLLENLKKLN